jgi:hypothetical protein
VWSDQFYGALFAQNALYAPKVRRWLGDDAFSALFRLLVRCTPSARTPARALYCTNARKRAHTRAHAHTRARFVSGSAAGAGGAACRSVLRARDGAE